MTNLSTLILCNYQDSLIESIKNLSDMAFCEDSVENDVTFKALAMDAIQAKAFISVRQDIVFSGALWMDSVFERYHHYRQDKVNLAYNLLVHDGQHLKKNQNILAMEGSLRDILAIERTLLNFLGRSTAIATLTSQYVTRLQKEAPHITLLDTRKTMPAYRYFDKYAVKCGGGHNHRMSLSDQILIKENHQAVFTADVFKKKLELLSKSDIFYELEVQNIKELKVALALQCPHIMLDNFTPEMLSEIKMLDKGNSKFEVSGGVNLENIHTYYFDFVDYMSIGALTHSVKVPDLTLLIDNTSYHEKEERDV